MQIVIDISKDTFEKIREFDGKHDVLIDRGKLYEAIQNGTLLTEQIEVLRRRVSELEDKMNLIESRSDLLQSSEERYYSSLGEDE